jgi:hypothetical protein
MPAIQARVPIWSLPACSRCCGSGKSLTTISCHPFQSEKLSAAKPQMSCASSLRHRTARHIMAARQMGCPKPAMTDLSVTSGSRRHLSRRPGHVTHLMQRGYSDELTVVTDDTQTPPCLGIYALSALGVRILKTCSHKWHFNLGTAPAAHTSHSKRPWIQIRAIFPARWHIPGGSRWSFGVLPGPDR